MNEFTLLQTLREDVAEPTPERLAPAYEKLSRAMHDAPRHRRRMPRARWVLAGIAGATALTLVSGNAAMAIGSAHAASVLQAIAGETVKFSDPVPGPGEYLLAHTRANWMTTELTEGGDVAHSMNVQVIDIYKPSDPNADWVLYRDRGNQPGSTSQDSEETIRAKDGAFYGGPWLTTDLAGIPLGSGTEVLAYFDGQYIGGSASRDEDNFGRIIDVLRWGLVPADVRAALFEALALIPGVTSTDNVANFDGKTGIAIGRTEALRGGLRQEIIIDPETGMVIGERQITTFAVFGFGFNQEIGLTTVETSVARSAP